MPYKSLTCPVFFAGRISRHVDTTIINHVLFLRRHLTGFQLALLLLPLPLAAAIEFTSTGNFVLMLAALFAGLCAALGIKNHRWQLALWGSLFATIVGYALGSYWTSSSNWALVILAGVLAANTSPRWMSITAAVTAILIPLRLIFFDVSMIIIWLLVIIATIVSFAIGTIVHSERARLKDHEAAITAQVKNDIADDLHDIVAHEIAGIVVLAQAGRAQKNSGSSQLLEQIESSGKRALEAIRDTVSQTRTAPVSATIADIERLVNDFAGETTFTARTQASTKTLITAERVISESLTNVLRHAHGAAIAVRLEDVAQGLKIIVEDSGGLPTPGLNNGSGSGLYSLEKRIRAMGGLFQAGPHEKGWKVEAVIP
ncbi:Two-component system sensor kinase protein [Corynebacterium pseudotuberculosis]|uniref:sensor histidine kinase n=1 Tax=Corynebacterium pseudotuberculosis TaxID=1719 RepID=UPI00065E1EB2|nr:histidine kinase [Corynebacterium pseudotuberculosis]AKP09272.1 Two-component system sensor kinase protein [Corynebacterium pseudotuberculosis]